MTSNQSLKIISLEKTKFSDKVAIAMADFLEQPHCKLEELNLSWNSIQGPGIKELAKAMSKNRSIRKLNLSSNNFQGEDILLLSASLRNNFALEELSLANNALGNQGIASLESFLDGHNSGLKVLDISKCNCGDDGLRILS